MKPTTFFSTDAMVWLAVRCCCTPSKVIGFLQVRANDVAGSDIKVGEHLVSIRKSTKALINEATDISEYQTERAVYSEDRPIEFWRTMPGFVEAVRR